VHRYYIDKDKSSLQSFYEHLKAQQTMNFSVPAIFFCKARFVGFETSDTSGAVLVKAMTYCREQLKKEGKLSPLTVDLIRQWGMASQFTYSPQISNIAPLMTLVTAVTDAFLPCSLFSFIAFLAFMWVQRAMRWRVGGVFLLALGLTHFISQWVDGRVFELIPYLRVIVIPIGFLLLFSLTSGMKSIFLMDMVVFFTTMSLEVYQQACGFQGAIIYNQWLIERHFSLGNQLIYKGIYQVIYLIPLVFLWVSFLWFSRTKSGITKQGLLYTAGQVILCSIGVLLVLYPAALSNLLSSIIVLLIALGIGVYYTHST